MNMGKARDPKVAIGLDPKNWVIADGLELKASRCMAFKNFLGAEKGQALGVKP